MRYQEGEPGDWGRMLGTDDVTVGTEELITTDGYKLFLRSWKTSGSDVLLILHGLGGHSGWYNDMGNVLARHGISVYAMDHRGFGRSGGQAGHIDDYHTYVEDIRFMLAEIRKRHPAGRIYMLGHSMGGLFAAYVSAAYGEMLSGVIFLNPWIRDRTKLSALAVGGILLGGPFGSKRYWQVAGGPEVMTNNSEAVRLLQADTLWGRRQTAALLFQLLLMRSVALRKARSITIPALILQAEADTVVVIKTNRTLYEALGSKDKIWKSYANYAHDSEFERDRSQMDEDIVRWIKGHS